MLHGLHVALTPVVNPGIVLTAYLCLSRTQLCLQLNHLHFQLPYMSRCWTALAMCLVVRLPDRGSKYWVRPDDKHEATAPQISTSCELSVYLLGHCIGGGAVSKQPPPACIDKGLVDCTFLGLK